MHEMQEIIPTDEKVADVKYKDGVVEFKTIENNDVYGEYWVANKLEFFLVFETPECFVLDYYVGGYYQGSLLHTDRDKLLHSISKDHWDWNLSQLSGRDRGFTAVWSD